ncbi:hexanoyl-CoA synthase-like [Actinidia eriantha]|uniref:hexanoyl-CoA synthase-like n=1 Tax=Actinidia eriantha TaxID=165200 RepID=UPI0025886D16|nr:hexanoyl-CoA synthase-like [Actinidia eriantha]
METHLQTPSNSGPPLLSPSDDVLRLLPELRTRPARLDTRPPERAASTNVGQLLERRGKEFLALSYKYPISSFSEFQEFSVSNPEVIGKLYWMK